MRKTLLWGAALFALFILMGCPKDPEPPKPFTLTVTDIPVDKFIGASLLNENDITTSIATGTPSGNTFTFYHPGSDGRLPDYSKPFNTPGNYLVALAEVDMTTFQETAVYFYCTNGNKSTVTFPTNSPLAWDDFEKEE